MIVLSDCDGVVADFVGGVCKHLQTCGHSLRPEQIRHWELAASMSQSELRDTHLAMTTPGFCHSLEWYEGAKDFLRTLSVEADLHILTAPFDGSESWMSERKTWLSSVIARDRVHFISGKFKHLVRGDVLIEDHPQNAFEWLEGNPKGIALLVDRPWNRPGANEWQLHQRMYRVHSFDEALRVIRETA